MCINQSIFINEWKTAIITPLYKNKGNIEDLNNYRGISVLAPLAKIFEKLLSKRIKDYFEHNNLFFIGQHGLRSNHSCETAIHEIASACLANIDKRLVNILLFIDFKKAFDMLDQNLLIYKLLNYGFDNQAIKLMIHYFLNRFAITKSNKIISSLLAIVLGVPQGSVLGPLLVILFINDLSLYLISILTKLFADDTTLIFANCDLDSVISSLKFGLNELNEWCKHNRL